MKRMVAENGKELSDDEQNSAVAMIAAASALHEILVDGGFKDVNFALVAKLSDEQEASFVSNMLPEDAGKMLSRMALGIEHKLAKDRGEVQ